MIGAKAAEYGVGGLDAARVVGVSGKWHEGENQPLMRTDPPEKRATIGLELLEGGLIEQEIVQTAIHRQARARQVPGLINLPRNLFERRAALGEVEDREGTFVEFGPWTSRREAIADNDEARQEDAAKAPGQHQMRRAANTAVRQEKRDRAAQ